MENFWEYLQNLTDAQSILSSGGFYLLLIVVFAETGLFFGFFLPGDYLLFYGRLIKRRRDNPCTYIYISTFVDSRGYFR
jgi:membrane protein DedA with SNARE-associated domain